MFFLFSGYLLEQVATIGRIAKALGIDPADLIAEEE